MAEIRWTKEAVQWLKEIYDYIAEENFDAAQKIIQNIYLKVEILKRFPEVGYRYHRYPEFHIRVILYGHYRIVYLIHPDQSIDILGVFHSSLDMDKYLFN